MQGCAAEIFQGNVTVIIATIAPEQGGVKMTFLHLPADCGFRLCVQCYIVSMLSDPGTLRTRKSGSFRFAELHLEMPENMELKDVHRLCDKIEKAIESRIRQIDINIHVEPVEKGEKEQGPSETYLG